MLEIFNKLQPFFEDNYRRINVREYARLAKISPPSASKLLSELEKEGLLKREEEKNYIYYLANKESPLFVKLSRAYWHEKLKDITNFLEQQLVSPVIILFGSFAKAEINPNSDIDLAVFTASKKKIELATFEKKLKRKIQIFVFKDREDVKSRDLLNNILNGIILSGSW